MNVKENSGLFAFDFPEVKIAPVDLYDIDGKQTIQLSVLTDLS